MDKRGFIGMIESGGPLIRQAIDAMREYHQAQDLGAPPEEIERLRLLAESLFQAVSDYQLRAIAKARGKGVTPSTFGCSCACLLCNKTSPVYTYEKMLHRKS